MMDYNEVKKIYDKNDRAINEQLAGLDHITANAFITSSYVYLFENNPSFIWFGIAGLVSSQVGNGIAAPEVLNISSTNIHVLSTELPKGNQLIFKDIVSIFLTYCEVGIEGLELLAGSDEVKGISYEMLEAFQLFDELLVQQTAIAEENGLELNDPVVLEALFTNPFAQGLIEKSAEKMAEHEQTIVQKMYTEDLTQALVNFINLPNALHLSGVTICGKYFPMSDYISDPSNLEERLNYANALALELSSNLIDENAFNSFISSLHIAQHQSINHANDYYDEYWMSASEHNAVDAIMSANWENHFLDSLNQFYDPLFTSPTSILSPASPIEPINSIVDIDYSIDPNQPIQLVFSEGSSGDDTQDNDMVINTTMGDLIKTNEVLELHPEYSLLFYSEEELINNKNFTHAIGEDGNTHYWETEIPSCGYSLYEFIITPDGDVYYYPYYEGEARGVNFPLFVDVNTGKPVGMPIHEDYSYEHGSSLDIILNTPDIVNEQGAWQFDLGFIHEFNYQSLLYWASVGESRVQSMITSNFFNGITGGAHTTTFTGNASDLFSGSGDIYNSPFGGTGLPPSSSTTSGSNHSGHFNGGGVGDISVDPSIDMCGSSILINDQPAILTMCIGDGCVDSGSNYTNTCTGEWIY